MTHFPLEFPRVGMPEVLQTPAFCTAWAEWLAYRSSRKLPRYAPITVTKLLNKLAGWGNDAAIASLEQSMEQGWAGVFVPRDTALPVGKVKPVNGKESPWALQQRAEAINEQIRELRDGRKGMVYSSGKPGEYPGYKWTPEGIAATKRLQADLAEVRRQMSAVEED